MITARLTSILFFVLSLGFLVCAAPSPVGKSLSARAEGGRMAPLSILEGTLRKQLDSCMRVKTVDEAKAIVCTITSSIKTANDGVCQGGKVQLDDHGKTDVAVRLASCVSLLAKIGFKLSQILGSDVLVSIIAELVAAFKELLGTVGKNVEGIFPLVVKKIADVKVEAFTKQYLPECAKLLGLA